MKKIFCLFLSLAVLFTSARADEGMWLLPLIQKMNAKTMKDMGCKLTPEEIYSINNSSLKDAVVQFGGGCTGEIISAEGLLVTNHHCGYSSIQKLSSEDHNYLEDGYWAMESSEEIPVPGLTVTFLQKMTDVTGMLSKLRKESLKQYKDSTNKIELADSVVEAERKNLVEQAEKDNEGCHAEIEQFYNGNVFYLIIYKKYKDVRFVGAPPASIGKFGGETDNWMWPRHTGDFSMFRVYAGKDNEPAEYSVDNVPYKPKDHLKISLNGVNNGDFTMIMGYPGRTQRFQTASQLEEMITVHDIRIAARDLRQGIMLKFMEADPAIRLKYANKYAGSANGYKKWIGEKKAFGNLGIIDEEKGKEAAFTKWVNARKSRKEKYGQALQNISESVDNSIAAEKSLVLLDESIANIELIGLSSNFNGAFKKAVKNGQDTSAALQTAYDAIKGYYKDYYEPLDRKEASALLSFYKDNASPDCYLDLGGDFKNMDVDAYVKNMFDNSVFTSGQKLKNAISEDNEKVFKDPARDFIKAIIGIGMKLIMEETAEDDTLQQNSRIYTAGLMEWNKGKKSYPDANFTMRLTYGTVKPYSPKDAVTYRSYTTMKGIMEKEDSTNYEFKVPSKLKKLYEAKDFGQYARKDGRMPICFLTNNDITGGNSGSPVMNGNGELIGLAFDGNWESMSSDVMFEPELQRCICVDIRYVLFLIDKYGGAGYLVKEMDLVQ
ncbi:MAG: S46 family peptidase [Bacteroidales bacterium]|jgi:hypothetical protein|nr:S46 family peptidase [Bacteroidales bacterium]MCI1784821.1 S46 family peptidase [Bacteroidales bacterium]